MARIDPFVINTSGSNSGTLTFAVQAATAAQQVDSLHATTVNAPIVTRCSREGHHMHVQCELVDGSLLGMCEYCGQVIRGRRLPGGLPLAHLRAELEDDLSGKKRMSGERLLELAEAVDAEEKALEEARALLRLGQRALMARRS